MGSICSLLLCRKICIPKSRRKKPVQLSVELASEKTASPKINPLTMDSNKSGLVPIDYRDKGFDGFPIHGWIHACSGCGIPTSQTIPGEDISMCKRCCKSNHFTL